MTVLYDRDFFMMGGTSMNNHPLESLIEQYLAEKDITNGSWDLYHTILNQYIVYLKEHDVIIAKTKDVKKYITKKRSEGYSSAWIYQQINAIKGLYRYLSRNQKRLGLSEDYAMDITETIKNERVKKHLTKPVLTIEEAKQLLTCTKEKRKYIWHYRDYAMIYLMLTTGIRSIEVTRAKKKDLRKVHNQLILYVQGKGKTSADDFVKITPLVGQAIEEYLEKRKDKNPYLFVAHSFTSKYPYLSRTFFLRMLRRVLRECKMEETKITPHSLRHTAATLNLLRGGSLEATKHLMRHASMSSTMVYAHHIDKLKDDSEEQIEHYILQAENQREEK